MKSSLSTSLSHTEITKAFLTVMGSYLILAYASDPAFAVTVEALKEPMKNLKDDMFGGWMMAAKIGACVVGVVMSVARSSLTPFGLGIGTLAGITFMDKYLGDGATGALI